ncbi:hypothetical protein WICPIJ_008154 [Wickerhamomyces pijperi]|uniref:Uncharacterized protein n=1 Tax=Wickerhamomyces pijperi TaxID=599730 RepID=A0A9P8TJ94_WICPI|nr:hypothetical protein WICPIJ_008154 [Wickerhamomyces pijperi]
MGFWQLTDVKSSEIIDSDVTRLQSIGNLVQFAPVVTKHRRAKAIRRRVGDLDGMFCVSGLHNRQDRTKDLVLCNVHGDSDISEQSRLEVVSLRVIWMCVFATTRHESGTLRNSLLDLFSESFESCIGDCGTHIDVFQLVDIRPQSELWNPFGENFH